MLDVGPTAVPGRAEVEVSIDTPATMPWLRLYEGSAGNPLRAPSTPAVAGLLPPTIGGARRVEISNLGNDAMARLIRDRERFELGCDPVQIGLHASANLRSGEAHVLRVRQRTEGILVGGYTAVLVKPETAA